MNKPLIGITCFSLETTFARSVVSRHYMEAVIAAGGTPIGIPVGLDHQSLDSVYREIDGLLLPGGDDVAPWRYGQQPHPNLQDVDEARDDLELALAARAMEDNLPVLGICRGIQVMTVAAGGTLYQDLPSELGTSIRHEVREYGRDHLAHEVEIERRSRLASILQCTRAQTNTFHHQAVRDIPSGFVVSSRADDGVVEAIEATGDCFAVGVQCHPEEMYSTTASEFQRLFKAFVDAAALQRNALRSSA